MNTTPISPEMLDRMVEAWPEADAQHTIRDTCRDLLSAALQGAGVQGDVERVAAIIQREARENGADSPVDYGDAEQLAKAVLGKEGSE